MNALHGLNIVPHPLALSFAWEVQRHAIRKRRRNWRAVRVERPGCYQIGNTLYLHPVLVEKLRAAASPIYPQGAMK